MVDEKLKEAVAFLLHYEGNFKFLVDIKKRALFNGESLTERQVDAVLRCRDREVKRNEGGGRSPDAVEPGVYKKDGTIYKVQTTRDKQRRYAKRLVKIGGDRLNENFERVNWTYEYAPGAIKTLIITDRMNEEDAKNFGLEYGICASCGRKLEQADSVERGIGPVCMKWFKF